MKKINTGGIREYKGLSNKDKFIADQLYYVISLKSILEKKNTIKNSLLPNINEYNLDEMTKKITKGNLEYALQQKSISDINRVLKTSINALIEEKEYDGSFKSFKSKSDAIIREELNDNDTYAPNDAYGFFSDKVYKTAFDKGVSPEDFGRKSAQKLMQSGWMYANGGKVGIKIGEYNNLKSINAIKEVVGKDVWNKFSLGHDDVWEKFFKKEKGVVDISIGEDSVDVSAKSVSENSDNEGAIQTYLAEAISNKLGYDFESYSNGGGVGEIGDNFRGKLNNDIKYVFVSDTFGSYLGNIPKIELFKDWESAKKSYIKYLKTSNNYMGNWTMALYECNGDCSIYSQGNVKKVKNAKQLNRFYGHHQYVEGKIIDSVKVDNKKFTINLIEEKEYANGGNMQGFCYTIGGL